MSRPPAVNTFPEILAVWLAIVCVFAAPAWADFFGPVVQVTDGDTLVVQHETGQTTIRLMGIDCPEKAQRFGLEAAQFVEAMTQDVTVTVIPQGQDRYQRTLGIVVLPDGRTLNQELVRHGLAWWFRKYSDDRTLAELELEARLAREGLWSHPSPVPPWIFRKLEPLFQ